MHEFKMPSLGSSMESGTVVEWKVEPGDSVERGDIVCEVETQKGNIDVEIWEAGQISEILVEPGRKVPVGEPLALLETGEAEVAAEPEKAEAAAEEPKAVEEAPEESAAEPEAEPAEPHAPVGTWTVSGRAGLQRSGHAGAENKKTAPADGRVKASPAARRRAAELGVDLAAVSVTGPDGAVTLDDVEQFEGAAESAKPAAADPAAEVPEHHVRVSPMARKLADELGVDLETVEGSGEHGAVTKVDVERVAGRAKTLEAAAEPADKYAELRQAIANAMERSKREIPHYYLEETVDMQRAQQWLGERNADRPPTERVLMPVLVAKAVARAAVEFPVMNGFFEEGRFEPKEAVHLGFAVAMRGGGVVTPAVHDFDSKDLDTLMADVRDLVSRVRGGKLRASELSDPTITVTNLGDQGVEKVYGVIFPPQVAIVGVGKISARPWAKEDMVGVHPIVTITLSADHRVSDGITGAKFLRRVAELLQTPEEL